MQSDDFRGLVLKNTLTSRKELFSPRNPGEVRIFTCGPSVYRRPHVGNYRSFLYEDILVRYLEYLGYRVKRTINFTDVEDKTISTAAEEGKEVIQVTTPVVEAFFNECKLLGIKLPDYIPRSSTSIDEAVEIIQVLMDKGHAYRHDGNIYFDPLTYDGFGEIFGLDMSRWPKRKVRYSQDTYPGQRWNLGDFILWHGHQDDRLIYWDTPIGRGRPSWNVQDPAMTKQTLGYEIDIHCGGIDNMWRHHDYNRAIMESASGVEFAHYWLHGEHLIVDGDKMSKSKGNEIYPEHLQARGRTGRHIRFLLIYGYYRDKLNVTDKLIDERFNRIQNIQQLVRDVVDAGSDGGAKPAKGAVAAQMERVAREIVPLFEHAMNDDLHVRAAVDAVCGALGELRSLSAKAGLPAALRKSVEKSLRRVDTVLGILFEE